MSAAAHRKAAIKDLLQALSSLGAARDGLKNGATRETQPAAVERVVATLGTLRDRVNDTLEDLQRLHEDLGE